MLVLGTATAGIWADLTEDCVDSFLRNSRFNNMNQANGGLLYLDDYFFSLSSNGDAQLQVQKCRPLPGVLNSNAFGEPKDVSDDNTCTVSAGMCTSPSSPSL